MKLFGLIVLGITFLSCGRESTQTTATLNLEAFTSREALTANYSGGIFLYGQSDRGKFFGRHIDPALAAYSIDIPFGLWTFHVLTWEADLFQGRSKCGKSAPIRFDGIQVHVPITISHSDCKDLAIDDLYDETSASPKFSQIKLSMMEGPGCSPSATATCAAPSLPTYYQVQIPEHDNFHSDNDDDPKFLGKSRYSACNVIGGDQNPVHFPLHRLPNGQVLGAVNMFELPAGGTAPVLSSGRPCLEYSNLRPKVLGGDTMTAIGLDPQDAHPNESVTYSTPNQRGYYDIFIDTNANAPVTANISPPSFNEDTQSIITLNHTHFNGDSAVSCTLSSPVNIVESTACYCTGGTCQVGVTGLADYHGSASFDYTVTGQTQTSNISNATFSINPVADPPVAFNITPPNLTKNTQSMITLSFTDADGDLPTSCSLINLVNVSISNPCTCSASTCTVGVTGTTNHTGPASFDYQVVTNVQTSNSANASLTINP